ncbi:uncharacterized protein METZ01_LOCUS86842 [marine metagenome]|uniref:OMP1 protein n=1 Tax=marine metagenome TaxID=408172 RepID=A0A381V2C3_9ZZZZ
MKRFLPLILLTGFSSPVLADITHKLSSSVQLSVSAGATQVERIGTTYSVSGSGVDTTYTPSGGSAVTDGIGSLTVSSGVGAIPTLEATQKTAGSAFSFSQTFTQGDAISQSAPSTGAVSNFSNQTSTGSGTAGDLAGTITTAGAVTVTAGGAGTVATGQFVNELTVN